MFLSALFSRILFDSALSRMVVCPAACLFDPALSRTVVCPAACPGNCRFRRMPARPHVSSGCISATDHGSQQQNGKGAKNGSYDRKYRNDADLRPASQFKMVVDRCHTEKTFAAGPAEPRHLNDDRNDLDKINKPSCGTMSPE